MWFLPKTQRFKDIFIKFTKKYLFYVKFNWKCRYEAFNVCK